MSAAHHGLSNLIVLVDINRQQADGNSHKILALSRWKINGPRSAGMCSA